VVAVQRLVVPAASWNGEQLLISHLGPGARWTLLDAMGRTIAQGVQHSEGAVALHPGAMPMPCILRIEMGGATQAIRVSWQQR